MTRNTARKLPGIADFPTLKVVPSIPHLLFSSEDSREKKKRNAASAEGMITKISQVSEVYSVGAVVEVSERSYTLGSVRVTTAMSSITAISNLMLRMALNEAMLSARLLAVFRSGATTWLQRSVLVLLPICIFSASPVRMGKAQWPPIRYIPF
jgi:hypothetical protein